MEVQPTDLPSLPIARWAARAAALGVLIVLAGLAFSAATALASTASTAPRVTMVYRESGWATPVGSYGPTNPDDFYPGYSVQFDQPVKITPDGAVPFIPLLRIGKDTFTNGQLTPAAAKMP